MIDISVIMPNHNGGQFIDEAIRSVAAQTFTRWELVICDDASDDESRQRIAAHTAEDSRITALYNEQRLGIAATRNRALQHAKGRYVAFLDSDDAWYPQKLERQLGYMRANQNAVCHSWYRIVDEEGKSIGRYAPKKLTAIYPDFLGYYRMGCSSIMLDTSLVGAVELPLSPQEDYAMALELMKRGFAAHCIAECLSVYRIRKHSTSRNKLKTAKDVWSLLGQQGMPLHPRLRYFLMYAGVKTWAHGRLWLAQRLQARFGPVE